MTEEFKKTVFKSNIKMHYIVLTLKKIFGK